MVHNRKVGQKCKTGESIRARVLLITEEQQKFGQAFRRLIYVNGLPALITDSHYRTLLKLVDGPKKSTDLDASPINVQRNVNRWRYEISSMDTRLKEMVESGFKLIGPAGHNLWKINARKIQFESSWAGRVPTK